MNYSALSIVYDRLTGNVDYKRRCSFILDLFKQNGITPGAIVLDAGCGTGTLTLSLAKNGFDMIGVDVSENMLAEAYQKSAGYDIRYLCQDITELDLYGTVNATLCMQDTLNHLNGLDGLRCALSRFSLFTEPGGLLLFDVNTVYKHESILADNDFVFEVEDGLCAWRNEYQPKQKRTKMIVDVFSKAGNGYNRYSDEFFEYVFSEADVFSALKDSGYEIVSVVDGDSYGEKKENSERLLFAARKAR